MTTAQNEETPVLLSRRSSQGIVLGLDKAQAFCAVLALVCVGLGAVRGFPFGLLVGLVAAVPFVGAAVWPHNGYSAPRKAGLWLSKQVRHATGGTRHTFRPEAPKVAGTLNLPGIRANVRLWDADELALVYNPVDRSVSFTAELEVPGFLMAESSDRADLAGRLSNVLASFTQRPGIKRVILQERTTPTTIRAARENYQEARARLRGAVPAVTAANYEEVMDRSETFAVSHRNFFTVTLDLSKLDRQIRELGKGERGVRAVALMEARNIAAALTEAEIRVRLWLNPRDVAALTRTVFDPASIPGIQNRSAERRGVDPIGLGPMVLEEPRGKNGLVITDSGVHTTLWVHEWPRTASPVGFIAPLVFARHPVTDAAISHVLSIVMTPVPVREALDRVTTERKTWRTNENLRAKRNREGSILSEKDAEVLDQQEAELVAGHGEFRYGAYLTVTAQDEAGLRQSVAGMQNALARAGMEAQILYCQQAEALMVNALPLGLGMR
ncbi:SCO6880 family protein [Microbacterium sp. SLBN-111]|uniref:SCO6880 family protein n=1 Tax=Microbacterium sp. SLBN-111 TaxID=3377733 RepID=UPI003C76AE6F